MCTADESNDQNKPLGFSEMSCQLNKVTESIDKIAQNTAKPGRSKLEKWVNYIAASLLAVLIPIVGLVYTILNDHREKERLALEKTETLARLKNEKEESEKRLIEEKKREAIIKLFDLNAALSGLDYQENPVAFINETISRISPQVDLMLGNDLLEDNIQVGQVTREMAEALDVASRLYFLKRSELVTLRSPGPLGGAVFEMRKRGRVPSNIIDMEIRFFEKAVSSLKKHLSMQDIDLVVSLIGAYAKKVTLIKHSINRDKDKEIIIFAQKALSSFNDAIETMVPEHIRKSKKKPIAEHPLIEGLYGPLSSIAISMRGLKNLRTKIGLINNDFDKALAEMRSTYAAVLRQGPERHHKVWKRAAAYVGLRLGDRRDQFEADKMDEKFPYYFLNQWYCINKKRIMNYDFPERGDKFKERFEGYIIKLKNSGISPPMPKQIYWNYFNYEYWSPRIRPDQIYYINKHLMSASEEKPINEKS